MFPFVTVSVLFLQPGLAPSSETPSEVLKKLRRIARPDDEPAEAERFYQMKRSVMDGGSRDVQERYSKARRRMRSMPRFSSRVWQRRCHACTSGNATASTGK